METREILRRLEEIEARTKIIDGVPHLDVWTGYDWVPAGYLGPIEDVPWLCQTVRDLLHELEAVAEAAWKDKGGLMNSEEISKRLKEIESHAREDIPWLVGVVRQLVARLEKLEAVAKAAREARDWFRQFGYNEWGIAVKDDFADHETVLMLLEAALTALEGEGGQ